MTSLPKIIRQKLMTVERLIIQEARRRRQLKPRVTIILECNGVVFA